MYQLEEELSVVREEKQALDEAVSQIRVVNLIVINVIVPGLLVLITLLLFHYLRSNPAHPFMIEISSCSHTTFSHHILIPTTLSTDTLTDNPLQQILAAQEETAAAKQELTQVKEEMARTIEAIASAQQEAAIANEQVATMKEVG